MPPVTPEGLLLQRIANRLDALFELLQGQATNDAPAETAGEPVEVRGDAGSQKDTAEKVEVRGDADTPTAPAKRRTTRKK